MDFYIDTEFREGDHQAKKFGIKVGLPAKTIDLISIAIVNEYGEMYFALNSEHDLKATWQDEWLRESVLYPIYRMYINGFAMDMERFSLSTMQHIFSTHGKTKTTIANEIQIWINRLCGTSGINFYSYYGDYDWVVFCWLYGRMIDLPKEYPMYCRDLKQSLDELAEGGNYERIYDNGRSLLKSAGKAKAEVPFETIGLEKALEIIKKDKSFPALKNEHDCREDAKWNKSLHKFIKDKRLNNHIIILVDL